MTQSEMWQSIVERRAGQFVYGVLTTGVYCAPTCPSRRPNRENVRFYISSAEAVDAGFRPCKRCQAESKIEKLCQYIRDHATEPLSLVTLAAHAGLSPAHLQRTFKAATGVSPKQYQEALRMQLFKDTLRAGDNVTTATYDAGFGSSSRIYERADTRLGMTPAQYRHGGRGTSITYVSFETLLGPVLLGATDRGLCYLQFDGTPEQLRQEYPLASIAPVAGEWPPELTAWIAALNAHLAGAQLHLPLDLHATAFQIRVWTYLQTIPVGHVQSYAEVAQGIGQPTAVRAVARACASNRVALVIPCHRVIRGTGELGGYRWGLARKRALLDKERAGRV